MSDPKSRIEVRAVTVNVPTYAADRGLPRFWPDNYMLKVEIHQGYVNIIGDSEGLRGLATQLLALAADNVPVGYADDLDDLAELDMGSAQLTIVRR
jgi:CO/xanthine dehydrogenase Mo-binding subunit